MSDQARLTELQTALRTKMSDNKAIADSFRIEDGTVVVSAQQKTAFDKNMSDIKEIKGLIEGLEAMNTVENWGSQAPVESIAAAAALATRLKASTAHKASVTYSSLHQSSRPFWVARMAQTCLLHSNWEHHLQPTAHTA